MRTEWKSQDRVPVSVGFGARIAALCALLTAMLASGGCVTITPASANREMTIVMPEPLPEKAWPTRYPEPINAIIGAAEKADEEGKTGQSRANRIGRILGRNNDTINHRVLGRGIVCEVPQRAPSDDAQFIYITNRIPDEDLAKILEYSRPTRIEREELLRWYFRLELPDAQHGSPRGMILHLTSIGDRRYERAVSERLRSRGWAILHVEPGRFNIPLLHNDDGLREPGLVSPAKLAANLDEYAADYAYAVEGVLAYLSEIQPEVSQERLVITGYSAGSLALPTIAALLSDKVDAAVFVGGGANVAGILADSKLTSLARRVRESRSVANVGELKALPAEYLSESRFDPYHTARYLADKPVLLLHAQFDAIVPARYGNLLYEQLGRPERWSYPLGHIFLFWALPSQAEKIAEWVDRAVPSH